MASAWLKFSFACLMFTSGAAARRHGSGANPSAHVVAQYLKNASYPANTVIPDWSTSDPHSHLKGGMKYEDGKLIVPETGTYYIYAQLQFVSEGRVQFHVNDNFVVLITSPVVEQGVAESAHGIGSFFLNAGDNISLMINPWWLPEDGTVDFWMQNYASFFGAFKISA